MQKKMEWKFFSPTKKYEHIAAMGWWWSPEWCLSHQIRFSSWTPNCITVCKDHVPLSADSHLDSDSDFHQVGLTILFKFAEPYPKRFVMIVNDTMKIMKVAFGWLSIKHVYPRQPQIKNDQTRATESFFLYRLSCIWIKHFWLFQIGDWIGALPLAFIIE